MLRTTTDIMCGIAETPMKCEDCLQMPAQGYLPNWNQTYFYNNYKYTLPLSHIWPFSARVIRLIVIFYLNIVNFIFNCGENTLHKAKND